MTDRTLYDPNQFHDAPSRTQTDPAKHPNQQDPATLLAPESAPDHHKTYHDREQPDPDDSPVQGVNVHQEDGENAPESTPTGQADGSGSERWGASDWTQAGQDKDGFPVDKGSATDTTAVQEIDAGGDGFNEK